MRAIFRWCAKRSKHADLVVVSIFVNPTQFAPNEDFDAYPRTLEADLARLAGQADLVFTPTAREIYPDGHATTISVGGPSAGLETDFRPHFFSGVATVVAKLLIAAMPQVAVFGEKDYQQLQVIRQMVRDLALPVGFSALPPCARPMAWRYRRATPISAPPNATPPAG